MSAESLQGILDKLKNDTWQVRKSAIETLLSYPEKLYLDTLENWLKNDEDALLRNSAMETYEALGERAVKSLLVFLKDDDPDIRIFAANILGSIKSVTAFSELCCALNDSYENVRIASAESLGKIGDERAIEPLKKAMEDTPWVAAACIEAIGEIGGEKAADFLYKCLEKEEHHGMTFAAIERAGDQKFIRRLTPFADRNNDLRVLALKAIVNISEREGVRPECSYFISLFPLLLDLQKSAQPELRRAAFIALSWAEDIRGLQYFVEALNDDELQEYAIRGIVSLGKKAVPSIIDALRNTRSNRAVLVKVLSMLGEAHALLRFANDEDAEVRAEIALAIGCLKTEKAKNVLSRLEQDSAAEVREAARRSLKNTGM